MPPPPASPTLAGQTSAPDAPWLVLWLSLVILATGVARFYGLEHLLVWHDEVHTLLRVFGYPQDVVQAAIFSGQVLTPADLLRFQAPDPGYGWPDALRAFTEHPEHAPLYYAAARLATDLPVAPLTAVRGLSAACSLLTIPAAYWLMRELFGRSPVPWIAAALVACSPVQLLFAQEARQYALWMLMLVSASAALARALRRDTAADWWLYGAGMLLGLYSHLLFLLALPAHALYALAVRWEALKIADQRRRAAMPWLITVGAALLLFTPWLWVVATRAERLTYYTGWMVQPAGFWEALAAWCRHLTDNLVDLTPYPDPWWCLLVLPLGWALAIFVRRAPRPAAWLLLLPVLIQLAVVLGQDLVVGGSRSQHLRYTLPALLSVQLMLAWTLGTALAAGAGTWSRRLALAALLLVIALGTASQVAIQRADTWSTKNFSAENRAVARLVNATPGTLVAASDEIGIGPGELISLAYDLDPEVRLWGQANNGRPLELPDDQGRLVLLTPSPVLLARLGLTPPLTPLPRTWQWFAVDQTPTQSPDIHADVGPTSPDTQTPGTTSAPDHGVQTR